MILDGRENIEEERLGTTRVPHQCRCHCDGCGEEQFCLWGGLAEGKSLGGDLQSGSGKSQPRGNGGSSSDIADGESHLDFTIGRWDS